MKFTLCTYAPGSAGRALDDTFDALHALDQECFPRGIAYSRRMLRWYLRRPGAECLIAWAGDEPPGDEKTTANLAGFILAEAQNHEGHIVTLDVAMRYRRAGAGSALLLEMENRMASHGVERMALETATNNEPAVAFWHRHGYRLQGVLRGYYPGRLDAFFMLKRLSV